MLAKPSAKIIAERKQDCALLYMLDEGMITAADVETFYRVYALLGELRLRDYAAAASDVRQATHAAFTNAVDSALERVFPVSQATLQVMPRSRMRPDTVRGT